MGRWFSRFAVAASAAALFTSLGGIGAAAQAPAWSIHYGFATGLFGGTTFDLDATGAYRLGAASDHLGDAPNRRVDLRGTLPADELAAIDSAVSATRPKLWSSRYKQSNCYDYSVKLVLTKRAANGAAASATTSWGCVIYGVPEDLRTLLVAVRSQIRARVPRALVDNGFADGSPGSRQDRWIIESLNGARRSVTVASDGTIASRSRESTSLYPLAPCPARRLGAIDATMLQRLRAMVTPSEVVPVDASADTKAVFDAAMADCGAPAAGLASPDYVVPAGAHWAMVAGVADGDRTASVQLDDQGSALVSLLQLGTTRLAPYPWSATIGPIATRVDATGTAALGDLVARADDRNWKPQYWDTPGGCHVSVQILRFDGTKRSAGNQTSVACDGSSSPKDLAALARFISDRFGRYAATPPPVPASAAVSRQ
jgi:hypothetical protein